MSTFSLLLLGTLRKNLRLRLQAPWSFGLQIFSTTTMLLVFFIVDRFQLNLFGEKLKSGLDGLNTSYFGYVALGLATAELANASLGGMLGQYQSDKKHRLFEHYLFSGVGIFRWAVVSGIANLFHAFFQFLLIFLVAILILGLEVPSFRMELAFFVFLLAMLPMWCLSLLSLSGALLFRRGNVVGFFLGLGFELMGGVYAPTKIFPSILQTISEILPITPALRSMQKIVYAGAGWEEIKGDLLLLVIHTGIYVPLSLFFLRAADRAAKRKGNYILD